MKIFYKTCIKKMSWNGILKWILLKENCRSWRPFFRLSSICWIEHLSHIAVVGQYDLYMQLYDYEVKIGRFGMQIYHYMERSPIFAGSNMTVGG